MIGIPFLLTYPCLVVLAGVSDLLTMKIPNSLSIILTASFACAALIYGLSASEWAIHLAGGAVVFVVCFGMFAAGWMGGGDAKLASSISLWLGLNMDLANFVVLTGLFGAALTLGLLVFRQLPILPIYVGRQDWIVRLHDKKTGIPYGIAIAAAAMMVFPSTIWFVHLSRDVFYTL